MYTTYDKLDPFEAYKQVMHFSAQRGENALRLALHAAVPQVLRPDLLHLLRLNFVAESIDDSAVEADVLFASFCEELGNGYFRFNRNSRIQLLTQLDPTYENDLMMRSQQVANFLLAYIDRQSRIVTIEDDPVFSAYLDVERWVALAFFDPDAAASQLAVALKKSSEESVVAVRMRIGGLASALATPLAKHRELLAFAAGFEALEEGNVRQAENLFEPIQNREIQVNEIKLRSPHSILREWSRQRAKSIDDVQAESEKKSVKEKEKQPPGSVYTKAKKEHVKVVLEGAEAIKKWRSENPDTQLDLSNGNLRRADFSHSNLAGANFQGANLVWADFRWCDLMDADLSGANLSRADFHKADCERANFSKADLSDTNLEDANLRNTDFDKARFSHTRMINTDLGGAGNLQTTLHMDPSNIDYETLMKSGHLPSKFLKGCGLSDKAIRAAQSYDSESLSDVIESEGDYYSCFISYSSYDHSFAERLYNDLQKNGVRCWFAPKEMRTGDRIRESVHEAIRQREKLLIILSEKSIESQWIENVVERSLSEERDRKENVLFPIQIDDAISTSGKAWAKHVKSMRHMVDFKNWQNLNAYQNSLEKLLSDLRRADD